MVDKPRLNALLSRVKEETDQLRPTAKKSDEELAASSETLPAAKYRFIVAIEACVDVARHIIASEGFRSPASFAEAFEVLGEHDLIAPELVDGMKEMAGFRNVLVHAYLTIDDEKVKHNLRHNLGDLDRFREAIARTIDA